ncbi:MAG: hypothetical protein M1833_001015 [Piccolia ochrophora]|nr:MAG: hypothetical protein M1833_001015 [Piccolia ochrophora]
MPLESSLNLERSATAPDSGRAPAISTRTSPPRYIAHRPRKDRTSFSSVKEDDSGVAQSFVDTKESSLDYLDDPRPAIDSDDEKMATVVASQQAPSFCCPCGRFRGWKQIRLSGRGLGKSSSSNDLRLLGGGDEKQGWAWEQSPERSESPSPDSLDQHPYPPGQSPLERLPPEVLDQILPLLALDVPSNGYTPRNVDLISCLLTSRTLHAATLTTLYERITVPRSMIFSKFLRHITQYPALGSVVRRLDFAHFSSVGLGRTKRMNSEINLLTADTLLKCLDLTPRLREFLAQEHLENDLNESVLRKLLCDSPQLRALDFCASAGEIFTPAFSSIVSESNPALPASLNLQRLSLHECTTLSSASLETLLSRLPTLTHLDIGRTQVTDNALFCIPQTARLTHLNLSRCTHLSGERVVDFLSTHPAVINTLVYLNLLFDISRYRLLSQEDVDRLLPNFPSTLRALHLSGAKIVRAHVPMLLPLTKHLEELSIGYSELTLMDINSFFVPKGPSENDDEVEGLSSEEQKWVPPALCYLDLTSIASVTASSLCSSSAMLLRSVTLPLEVLEIGEKVKSGLAERPAMSKRTGWTIKECGRRAWYVRKHVPDAERDTGRRTWKMGAMWWGLRKVPVAWGEVGGLYGHYMFKK